MNKPDLHQLKTVEKFCRDNDSFTVGGLRHIIFHKESNGFAPAIYKLGRRVYLHEGKFFQIMEEQNHAKA